MPLPDTKKSKSRLAQEPRSKKPRASGNKKPHIRCVIFDLDDTLYDCLGQRVPVTHRYAAQAMVKAGLKASADAVYRVRMRAFRQDPMLRHIDAEVSRHFGAKMQKPSAPLPAKHTSTALSANSRFFLNHCLCFGFWQNAA